MKRRDVTVTLLHSLSSVPKNLCPVKDQSKTVVEEPIKREMTRPTVQQKSLKENQEEEEKEEQEDDDDNDDDDDDKEKKAKSKQ